MKINISTKELDTEKLKRQVEDFECMTNQTAILFTNAKTMTQLIRQVPHCSIDINDIGDFLKGRWIRYRGNRVYNNEDLDYGEFDIR